MRSWWWTAAVRMPQSRSAAATPVGSVSAPGPAMWTRKTTPWHRPVTTGFFPGRGRKGQPSLPGAVSTSQGRLRAGRVLHPAGCVLPGPLDPARRLVSRLSVAFLRPQARPLARRERARVRADRRRSRPASREILHFTYRSVSDYLRRLEVYSTLAARDYRQIGKTSSAIQVLGNPLATFLKCYLLKRGFLDGFPGGWWPSWEPYRCTSSMPSFTSSTGNPHPNDEVPCSDASLF